MINSPEIINRIFEYSKNQPNKIALINPLCNKSTMTYGELFSYALSLSKYISENSTNKNPIVVFGHKNPYMIVCFLACVLSGHAYCPVDSSMPKDRVDMILEQTNSDFVFAVESFHSDNVNVIALNDIVEKCMQKKDSFEIPYDCVKNNDTYYIIFTSGSTGTPKGVEISANDLDNFLVWSSTLGDKNKYTNETVFLNQAPFSFDLSVMDLYTSLYCGGTLCMMEKSVQKDFSLLSPFIKENKINAIVATPSFINMCLLDKNFNETFIPSITSFFFCGEVLSNKTAKKVIDRFPNAIVQNTYGPTESTVAVSNVIITPSVLDKYDILPVGKAKPGTMFLISSENNTLENGHEVGEVLILGDTLANGYFKRDDLTAKSFIYVDFNGKKERAYRTGDLGYLENDELFYCGRIDLQIKLNGFRIELGDIESCILKNRYIENCAVIPRKSGDKVKGLVAVLVLTNNVSLSDILPLLKKHLVDSLPSYMIPQSFEVFDKLPVTNNGKIDRKEISKKIEEF